MYKFLKTKYSILRKLFLKPNYLEIVAVCVELKLRRINNRLLRSDKMTKLSVVVWQLSCQLTGRGDAVCLLSIWQQSFVDHVTIQRQNSEWRNESDAKHRSKEIEGGREEKEGGWRSTWWGRGRRRNHPTQLVSISHFYSTNVVSVL